MGKYNYLVHRCPQCNSNQVGNLTVKPKSGFQKGAELAGYVAENYVIGTDYFGITEKISNFIYDPEKQNKFYCKECKHAWKNPNMVDETPIEVLEQEKRMRISSLQSSRVLQILGGIVCSAIGIWAFYYCWVNDFTSKRMQNVWPWGEIEVTDYHWGWPFVGLIFLGMIGATIYFFGCASESSTNINTLKTIGAEQFRKSRLRI